MSPVTAFIISISILILALGLPVLTSRFRTYSRARKYRRESERFKREPRVGDKAGYPRGLRNTPITEYMVGEVIRIAGGPVDYLDGAYTVELATSYTTALGTVNRSDVWNSRNLRYFPPDTPLGIVSIDEKLIWP